MKNNHDGVQRNEKVQGDIVILSGEGTEGVYTRFRTKNGKTPSIGQLEKELIKQRAGGDRWAKIYMEVGNLKDENGDRVYMQLFAGHTELRAISENNIMDKENKKIKEEIER